MGSPPISLLPGVVRAEADGLTLHVAGARLTPSNPRLIRYLDKSVIVGIRAESVALTEPGNGDLDGIVAFQEDLGANVLTTLNLAPSADAPLVEDLAESEIPNVGTRVRANVQARLLPGAAVGVSLDSQRLLFFDPATKLAID